MPSVFQQASFVDRDNFPNFLNEKGLVGEAVEVGVHRGVFAKVILDHWKGRMLHLVDPWSIPLGYEEQAKNLISVLQGEESREMDLQETHRILLPHGRRYITYSATSERVLRYFADKSLDFVYLDGDHRHEEVLHDLQGWWSKLKPGGILGGHDWICHPPDTDSRGVQSAVTEFAKEASVDVFLVVEMKTQPWSYYLIKE